MILQHYGVNTPEGVEMDPNTLNGWLLSQTDGYIGPGLINWIAVTRYVRESYDENQSPTKLEFIRSYLPTPPHLPAILGLPGHFVVAHGQDDVSWNINDPADEAKKTLAKDSAVQSINRYVPSNTDLSYMLFVTNPSVNLTLRDQSNNLTPLSWTDEYLQDDIDGMLTQKKRVAILAKPSNGTYHLSVTQDGGWRTRCKFAV
jgi:hypothetical protein